MKKSIIILVAIILTSVSGSIAQNAQKPKAQAQAQAQAPKKTEVKKTEAKKEEPKKTEPQKEEPKKEEEKKEEPTKTETQPQYFYQHEFSGNLGGGISSLQTKPTTGDNMMSWTGTGGLGYHFFFCPKWGIGTGVNFAIYNGGVSIDDYKTEAKTITGTATATASTPFTFETTSSSYKDKQQAMMLTIPIMVQYQDTGKVAFYGALGGKIGIPISGKSTNSGSFTTKGYFDPLSYPVPYEDIPSYGFVTDKDFPENKADLDLKTAFMVSAEAGVKWRLSANTSLYTGLYFDYGLNNILDKPAKTNQDLVTYQPNTPTEFIYSSATNSYVKQIAPLAAGITVRFAFGTGKKDASKMADEKKEKKEAKAEKKAAEEKVKAEKEEAKRLAEEKARAEKKAAEEKAKLALKVPETKDEAKKEMLRPVQNFNVGISALTPEQIAELDLRVDILKKYPDIKVRIEGHTCDLGSELINEDLGMKRAKTGEAYLLMKGIDKSRIVSVVSKGKSKPLVPNTSEANRKLNRRIEFVPVEK